MNSNNIDLINDPDQALHPVTRASILNLESLKGLFTPKKLSDYIMYEIKNIFYNLEE